MLVFSINYNIHLQLNIVIQTVLNIKHFIDNNLLSITIFVLLAEDVNLQIKCDYSNQN